MLYTVFKNVSRYILVKESGQTFLVRIILRVGTKKKEKKTGKKGRNTQTLQISSDFVFKWEKNFKTNKTNMELSERSLIRYLGNSIKKKRKPGWFNYYRCFSAAPKVFINTVIWRGGPGPGSDYSLCFLSQLS